MDISDFITNKRFVTVFIDGWLYEKIDGDIIKIKPYGKGAGAFILSDDNQWLPYEYAHFKDIVEYFGPLILAGNSGHEINHIFLNY